MRFIAMCWLALCTSPALAQDDTPDPTLDETTEEASPVEEPSATEDEDAAERESEASALYRVGLDLVGSGKYAEACGVFSRVSDRYPSTSYAVKAEEQMALAAMAEGGAACGGAPPSSTASSAGADSPRSRDSSGTGRGFDGNGFVELLISQGLMGPALLGVGIPGSLGSTEPLAYVGLGIVGLGAGITAPLLINSRWKIGEGQAMTVFSGEYVGGLNGAMLATLSGTTNGQGIIGMITGGVLVGGAAGITYAVLGKPHAGDVALFRSGFSWGAYVGAVSFLFVDPGPRFFARIILTADILGAVGAGLSAFLDISRVRMNVINLSGFAGAAGLSLLTLFVNLATPGNPLPAAVWGSTLIAGAAGGLALGAVLTRRMDDDRKLAFIGASGSLIAFDEGRWGIGAPTPMPRLVHDGSMGWQVGLASGHF